jgi:hypothetical protein
MNNDDLIAKLKELNKNLNFDISEYALNEKFSKIIKYAESENNFNSTPLHNAIFKVV